MNISAGFIRRPVATVLLTLALFFLGILAYKQLPIASLPEVDYPTIQVVTLYPGSGPDTMAALVTSPLEKQLGRMPGLESMMSSSSAGASVITLQFSLNVAMGNAEQEVQAAINAATNLLPNDLPSPPVYNKVNPADSPVMTLAITSSSLRLNEVRDLVETRVLQKIAQVSGVGLVSIAGGQQPAFRVQANPVALAANGLTMSDLRTAVSRANINQPTGSLNGDRRSTTLYTNSQLQTTQGYEDIILKYVNGSPLRLSQVASVVQDAQDLKQAAWLNGQQVILLNVKRQPQANVIDVVDAITNLLPELQGALPKSVQLLRVTDRTQSIRQSIHSVQTEMLLAMALVILVTFVFLRNFRATIIPSIVVPLSIIGTFAAMYLLGYSLNNLSLMALTIATGFVVDDAIVMIENISRHIEEGHTPRQAAFKGAKEIGFTLISLTLSLIAVLFPLLFMSDVIGRLFNEFAMTLALSILISLVISLSLTPMMCAYLLKGSTSENVSKDNAFTRWTGAKINQLIDFYAKCLDKVLRHQLLTLLVAMATLLLTVFLYIVMPKGFFPTQDNGIVQVITQAEQGVSFKKMAEKQLALGQILIKDPAIESVTSYIGVDGSNNSSLNTGRMQINLKDFSKRDDMHAILERLQKKTASLPGIQTYYQASQDLTIDTQVAYHQFQLTLSSLDVPALQEWVPKFLTHMRQIEGISEAQESVQNKGLEAMVSVNRDAAARYGISLVQVEEALYDAFGQRLISTVFTQSNQYRVVLEVEPEFSQSLENLEQLYVPSENGPIRLTEIAQVKQGYTALEVQRVNQFSSTVVSFNLKPGYSLSDVTPKIENLASQIGMPASVDVLFQGSAKAFKSSLNNTLWLILAAIFTMYIILGVLYESFIHPVTILSTLPSAGVGALLALMLTGNELDMVGIIGIILLIGIVKKNAILIVDFTLEAERKQGLSALDAVRQAALLRFRPILMTTLAAMFGAVPLMLSTGMGAEMRVPLGLVIVGGLVVSQLLTLFTTPVIYLYFDRLSQRWRKHGAQGE